jgi:predicted MFS family arabinose efflux permease
VGADRVVNAVSLNSVLVHTSRIVGPALAGVLIALWGVEPCFGLNALSFAAMIVALARMEPASLRPAPTASADRGAVREALRYVRRTPELAIPLALMAAIGTLAFNFQTVLPLLARFTFDGGASTYAVLIAAMGVGAVIGALANGARGRVSAELVAGTGIAMGALSLLAAAAPSLAIEIAILVPLGASTVIFAASVNSALQLAAAPAMRGRVMALYAIVFLGSTAIGGPLSGWLSEAVDPRAALVMAGASALAAGLAARSAFARAAEDGTGVYTKSLPVVDQPLKDAV